MKFTVKEMISIERTADKLANVAYTVWDRETTDAANARAIQYIISEMRLCASLLQSQDRTVRLAAADRIADILTK